MQILVTLSLCLICTFGNIKKVNVSLNIGLLDIVRPKEIKHDMSKRTRAVGVQSLGFKYFSIKSLAIIFSYCPQVNETQGFSI